MATQAASSHQQSQAVIAASMAPGLTAAWSLLDLSRMATTLPNFTKAVEAVIARFSKPSAALATRYYLAERAAAGVTAPFTPRHAERAPSEQVAKTVEWATQPLWSPGVTSQQVEAAHTNLQGAAERLVLNAGRLTVADAVMADREARGWARVPEPGCCSFCALLATRGAVYKNEATAGRSANARFVGEGEFKFHDHCRCHIEPTFTSYEPTAQVRAWQQQYAEATAGVSGTKNLLNAWRRSFEGRA